ncbi:lysoplasmalogenase [Aquimarina sp. TRL1]|uniref:lysoplasmalogenase n=1 Tax=Aquimarina sp. (strain TRL1) TaxID=2736252 RepID=UPI0034CDF0EA
MRLKISSAVFGIVYLLFVLMDLLAIYAAIHMYRCITKPLIMFSLIVWVVFCKSKLSDMLKKQMVLALVFSLLGDVFLLFDAYSNLYFLAGLFSFLCAHLSYIFIFWKKRGRKKKQYFLILMTLYGVGLYSFLFPYLEEMRYPVLVYTLVILMMGLTAYHRRNEAFISYKKVMIGVILFIISDSILAVRLFVVDFFMADYLVMITYALAQFFIIFGILAQEDKDFGRYLRKNN